MFNGQCLLFSGLIIAITVVFVGIVVDPYDCVVRSTRTTLLLAGRS